MRASPTLNAEDIRVSVQILVGSNNAVISGWRDKIETIVVDECKARARTEADKHSATLQRPGYVVTMALSEPVALITAPGERTYLTLLHEEVFDFVKEEIDDLLRQGKQATLNVTVTFRGTVTTTKRAIPASVIEVGVVGAGLPANTHTNANNNPPKLDSRSSLLSNVSVAKSIHTNSKSLLPTATFLNSQPDFNAKTAHSQL